MAEVYVKLRDGEVHKSSCMGIAATGDYDKDGGLVGIEILGAIEVTVEGRTVHSETEDLGARILDLPMQDNDAGASTVREYLCTLLAVLWDQQECFGGKKPFGNSGWHHELYEPLVTAGILPGELETDEDEEQGINWSTVDYQEGNRLVRLAIEALSGYTKVEDEASRVVFGRG